MQDLAEEPPRSSEEPEEPEELLLRAPGPRRVQAERFANGMYVREEFLRGSTLAKAMKKYAK